MTNAEIFREIMIRESDKAEMFRQMTDEQLAVWICMITAPRGDGKKNMRLRTWLERLKQEVNEKN